jgi:DNA processing protein
LETVDGQGRPKHSGGVQSQRRRSEQVQAAFPDDRNEAALFALVGHTPQHIDDLRCQSDLLIPIVSSTLAMLELKGLISQTDAMQYVQARETRAAHRVE